jgi:tetratricopeptide (TPR) repeat protein
MHPLDPPQKTGPQPYHQGGFVGNDPWYGKDVFYKIDAEAWCGSSRVDISQVPWPATILRWNDEWFWLEVAWVRKCDVLLPKQAVAYFSELIAKDPDNAQWWCRRADAKCGEGAISDYSEAIRLDPRNVDAYRGRAYDRKCLEHYESAILDLTEAMHLDSNNADILWERASVRQLKGDYELALSDLTEAIRLDPNDTCAFASRAEVRSQLGNLDGAVQDLTEIIRLDPNNDRAYTSRAEILFNRGDIEATINDYVEVLKTHPDHYRLTERVAWWRATHPDEAHRNGKQAVEFATRLCETPVFSWQMIITAAAYAEAGDFESAVTWAERAMFSNDVGEANQRRLDLYRRNQPYREPPVMNIDFR